LNQFSYPINDLPLGKPLRIDSQFPHLAQTDVSLRRNATSAAEVIASAFPSSSPIVGYLGFFEH
jgi:hypothetical protein